MDYSQPEIYIYTCIAYIVYLSLYCIFYQYMYFITYTTIIFNCYSGNLLLLLIIMSVLQHFYIILEIKCL